MCALLQLGVQVDFSSFGSERLPDGAGWLFKQKLLNASPGFDQKREWRHEFSEKKNLQRVLTFLPRERLKVFAGPLVILRARARRDVAR